MSTIRFWLLAGLLLWLPAANAGAQESSQDASQEEVVRTLTTALVQEEQEEQETEEQDEAEPVRFAATHKQTKIFYPEHEGEKIALHTFCMDNEGRLLAGVGGNVTNYVYEDGEAKMVTEEGQALIQVYSHEQELLQEYPIDITPTAVNVDNSGNIYVGGDGKVIKLTEQGEVKIVADSPALMDVDQLKEKNPRESRTTVRANYRKHSHADQIAGEANFENRRNSRRRSYSPSKHSA